jgi:hypothetical protein
MKTWAFALLPAVLILTSLALLLALAYASPPDPSWIPGIYDDADYDDVVTLVMASTANVATATPVDARPTASLVEHVPPFTDHVAVTPSHPARLSRAPPVL